MVFEIRRNGEKSAGVYSGLLFRGHGAEVSGAGGRLRGVSSATPALVSFEEAIYLDSDRTTSDTVALRP